MPVDSFEGPSRIEPVAHAIRGAAHYLIAWAGNRIAIEQGEYPWITSDTVKAVHEAIEDWWVYHENTFWEYFSQATGDQPEIASEWIHHPLMALLYSLTTMYLAEVSEEEAAELLQDQELSKRRTAEAAFAFINDPMVRQDYTDLLWLIQQIVATYDELMRQKIGQGGETISESNND